MNAAMSAATAARACVLVVDGDAAVRALLADAFADEGLATLGAANAEQAHAVVDKLTEADRIVIVLWDVEATRHNGYAAIRQIQRRGIPVLVMHSFPTGDDLRSSRAQGVDGVVAKPFELDELMATVATMRAPA